MSWLGITSAGPDEDGLDWEPDGLDDQQWGWAMDDLAREQERIRQLLFDETEPYLARIREAREWESTQPPRSTKSSTPMERPATGGRGAGTCQQATAQGDGCDGS